MHHDNSVCIAWIALETNKNIFNPSIQLELPNQMAARTLYLGIKLLYKNHEILRQQQQQQGWVWQLELCKILTESLREVYQLILFS